jgi:hypothetical protein
MKEPRYYRARVALLKELIAKEMELNQGDDKKSKLIPILRSGKFPKSLKGYENLIEEKQKEYTNEPLTDLEIFSFNTYFTLYPQLVAGVESDGTGFLNPIEIEGDYALIDQVTDIDLPQLPSSINQAPTPSSNTDPKADISNGTVTTPYGFVVEHESYKKGDVVEINYDGAWHKGTITGLDELGAGEIDIRVDIVDPFHPHKKLDVGGTSRMVRKPKTEPLSTWYSLVEYRTLAKGEYRKISNKQYLETLQPAFKMQANSVGGNFLSYLFHKVDRQELVAYESLVIPDYVYDSLTLPTREGYFGITNKKTTSDGLAVGDTVLYNYTETKITALHTHDKRKVFIQYEYNSRYLVDVEKIEIFPKEPIIKHSDKRSVEDLPNIVVRRAKTDDGTILAYVYGTHSGTVESIEDLAERVTEYMYHNFPDAVAHRSGFVVTDVEGMPTYRIAPTMKAVPLQAKEPIYNEISQPDSQLAMKIPSGYRFNFKGLGHTTKKVLQFPAIETELIAELSKLGAENLWNKPRHDNSLIYHIDGHRIEMFFEENEVKINVTTSLTYAGAIQFANKSVEQLASDIDTLCKQYYTHRRFEKKPPYEPAFYEAPSATTANVSVAGADPKRGLGLGSGTVGNTEVSATSMAILAQSIEAKKRKDQKQEKLPDTLSFDEVISLYNPGITKQ